MRSDSEHDRRDIPCITFGEYLIYKNKLAWSDNFSLSDLADKITEDDHIDYILNGWRFDDSFRTTEDYFFTVLRFLYDMEIIEFVKPLDDTELDDFLYGFVISWDTPEELLRVRFEVLFIIGWATIQVNCILTT